MPLLEAEFWVPADINAVWDFYKFPKNLEEISPPYLGVEVEGNPETRPGEIVRIGFEVKGYRLPFKWQAEISEVEDQGRERKFVDLSSSALFSTWKHEHLFVAGDAGFDGSSGKKVKMHRPGTWIKDKLLFELGPSILQDSLAEKFVAKILAGMFSHRKRELTKRFV